MSEPQVKFVCTHLVKEGEQDHYQEGAVPGTRFCAMDCPCTISAPTLKELISKVGSYYGLDIDDVFLPIDNDNEEIAFIGYNRLENSEGNEPSPSEQRAWQRGDETLYLADYSLHIEKRIVQPIHKSDFDAAGITTH